MKCHLSVKQLKIHYKKRLEKLNVFILFIKTEKSMVSKALE